MVELQGEHFNVTANDVRQAGIDKQAFHADEKLNGDRHATNALNYEFNDPFTDKANQKADVLLQDCDFELA